MNLEKFNEFYDYKYTDGKLEIISKNTGETTEAYFNAPIFLVYGDNPFSRVRPLDNPIERYRELDSKGLLEQVFAEDLYRELLGFNEEQIRMKKFSFSKKSFDYINSYLKSIGFLYMKTSYNEIEEKYLLHKFDNLRYLYYGNFEKDFKLFKLDNNEYAMQFYEPYPTDDYQYVQYFYSKEPSQEMFYNTKTLFEIRELLEVYRDRDNLEFINGVHWTECNLSFKDSLDTLRSIQLEKMYDF